MTSGRNTFDIIQENTLAGGMSSERGVGLVETLIGVAILGLTLTVLLAAVSTGSLAVSRADERAVAENLARSQLEYTKSQSYLPLPATYATVTPPAGYAVTVDATAVPGTDAAIEKVTVNVSRDGRSLLTVEDFKVDR
jgi:type II secretory pathway pseudopilin PulG